MTCRNGWEQKRSAQALIACQLGVTTTPSLLDVTVQEPSLPFATTTGAPGVTVYMQTLGDLAAVEALKNVNVPVLAALVDEGYDVVAAIPSCVGEGAARYPAILAGDHLRMRLDASAPKDATNV